MRILWLQLVFFAGSSFAQENNYWTSQVGATATLMGGAMTGSVRDNSALFYNPAALGYIENPSLSMVGNAYYVTRYNIDNGAGQNLNLKSTRVDNVPQLFSGVFKRKDNPYFTFSWGIFNTEKYTNDFRIRNDISYDVIESRPGNEYYSGTYQYFNQSREDWFGLGLGQRVGKSKNFAIGLSLLLNARSQDVNKLFTGSAIAPEDTLNRLLASVDNTEVFDYRDLGFVAKVGVSKSGEHFSYGLTVTLPKIDVSFIGKAGLNRSYKVFIPSQGIPSSTQSFFTNNAKAQYKSPWIFDGGMEFRWDETNILTIRAAYFMKINPYNILIVPNTSNQVSLAFQGTGFDSEKFGNMQTANRPVLNFGIGFAHKLVEGWGLLAGFHTDYNNFDEAALPRSQNFVPTISTVDLYHSSIGVIWYREKFDIETGIRYSAGLKEGDQQQINMSDPKDYRLLQGVRDFSANSSVGQFLLTLGFTYKFPRI